MIMSVVIGGLYEHYKGKQYKVIGVANHSETLEKMVIYQALYGEGMLWARPYEMFCEKIYKEGEEKERFKYLGDKLDAKYKIYLEMPLELRNLMFENNIDLEKELIKQVEDIEVKYEEQEVASNKKEIGLVILASGIAVSAVILSVARLIRVVNERPRLIKVIERTAEGMVTKEESLLLEPNKTPQKIEVDFELGTENIKLKIVDENN